MRLKDSIKLTGVIEVVTGLHIGGSNEAVEIGGLDNEVVKNPLNKEPYIPGSSLKGKLRFISEWKLGKVIVKRNNRGHLEGDIHACTDEKCKICRIFGTIKNSDGKRGPTRFIVRDAMLDHDFDQEKMLEVKYGTAIDRVTGTAKGGSLRNIERVTPGTTFKFEMIYRVFDLDDDGKMDQDNFCTVVEALQALENDTLGGSGSRGCGKVKFTNITVENGEDLAGTYSTVADLLQKVVAE